MKPRSYSSRLIAPKQSWRSKGVFNGGVDLPVREIGLVNFAGAIPATMWQANFRRSFRAKNAIQSALEQ
jgi:hypothetical protein